MTVRAERMLARVSGLLSPHIPAIYGMIGRSWLILTGPITIIVLTVYFTPYAQGYFFTFMSLAAARTVAELGLGQVIIVKVAQLCPPMANSSDAVPPPVAGLIQFATKWFAGAGFVVGALLCVGGTILLGANKALPTAEWLPPWIALSWLVGIDVALSGLLFPIEGAGRVRSAYFCRMVRSFINSLVLWLLIVLGLQLWSISIALACSLVWTAFFLFSRARFVVDALRPGAAATKIDWLSEVFPAQWRLALSSLAEYIGFSTVIPLMYVMHGTVVAGQLGVTWQLAEAVASIAGAIVFSRFPEFSRLAGTRSSRELDGLFLSTSGISMALCFLGALGVGLGVLLLQESGFQVATRMLPLEQVVLLMFGLQIWHFNLPIVSYLRAHGGDPYLPASVIAGVLLFTVTVTLGRWFGPAGWIWGYTILAVGVMLPLGLFLLRRQRRACGYPAFKLERDWAALMSRSR